MEETRPCSSTLWTNSTGNLSGTSFPDSAHWRNFLPAAGRNIKHFVTGFCSIMNRFSEQAQKSWLGLDCTGTAHKERNGRKNTTNLQQAGQPILSKTPWDRNTSKDVVYSWTPILTRQSNMWGKCLQSGRTHWMLQNKCQDKTGIPNQFKYS